MSKSLKIYPHNEHKINNDLIDPDALNTIQVLKSNGFDAYLVGGCVRDLFLGFKPKDFDVVTNAHPDVIRKIFKNSQIIGRRFKIVHVYFDKRKYIEVSTFRADISSSNKSHRFKGGNKTSRRDNFYGSISQDAYRRDFTINSLYYDIETKKIHDYVGGIKDLETKTLKAIKNPDLCFREDSVRMLRAVKFESKLPVELPTDHKKSIVKNAYYLLEASPSRLFDDVIKIMHCGNSIEGFQKLKEYNLFKYLFPRINSLIKNNQKYDSMIVSALKNTDKRFNEGLSLNPAFIYAVILWPLFEEKSKTNKKTYLFEEFEKILFEQSKNISIPNFFQPTIFQIWRMQDKFFDLSRKNIEYMVRQEKFRAAFDFFLIRSNVDSDLLEYSNNWQDVYDNLK